MKTPSTGPRPLAAMLSLALGVALTLAGCAGGDTRAAIIGYRVGAGRTLILTVELGPADTVKTSRVTAETSDKVTVETLIERGGQQADVAIRKNVEVQLASPLGNRKVVAAGSETPVPSSTST